VLHDRRVIRQVLFLEEAPRGEGYLKRVVREGIVAIVHVDEGALGKEEDALIACLYPPDRYISPDAWRRE